MLFFTKYIIKDRFKYGAKVIVAGIYSGNYGHFFCSYIPWLAKFRREHPDDIIIAAGDKVFYPYVARYADFYYGYEHPWNTDSPPSAPFKQIMNFKEEVEKDFKIDKYIDLLVPGEEAHNIFMEAVEEDIQIYRNWMIPYNPKSNIIVLWPRFKNASTWRNNHPRHWAETAEALLDRGFEVYCVGVPEAKVDVDKVISVNYKDVFLRGTATHSLIQEARCVLMDQSGVFNQTLFVGCPTLIFNSDPHHLPKIRKRNIFQTKLSFYNPHEWPSWTDNPLTNDYSYVNLWLVKVFEFIRECETSKPYELEVANHKNVFTRR